ncbi:MAG: hypothetical protein ABR915_09040 [Thermoguttaceae bacterium]
MTAQPCPRPQSSSTGRPCEEKGTVPICAKHPSGRSGKWGLSPFPRAPQQAPAVPRSVELQAPITDLSKLLAGDATLCAQRPPAPIGKQPQPPDPQLARVIDAWPGLPESIRAAMLAVVQRGVKVPDKQ